MKNTKKLAIAGMLVALSVVGAMLSIPVGASRCSPVQHTVNVVAAVVLGPYYGVIMAFLTSLIRIAIGTGTLLAFPGSMCGAALAGITYKLCRRLSAAAAGELIGTGVFGGLLAYPMAVFLMGREAAALGYVIPFLISSFGGAVIALVLLVALKKTGILKREE